MQKATFERIYDVVKQIPYGKGRVNLDKYQWNQVTVDLIR